MYVGVKDYVVVLWALDVIWCTDLEKQFLCYSTSDEIGRGIQVSWSKSMRQLLCWVGHFSHFMKKALHTICYPLNQNKMHSLSPLLVPGSESRPNSHSSGSTSWSGLEISSLSRAPFVVIERVSSEFLTSSLTYSSDSVWRNCHYSSVR